MDSPECRLQKVNLAFLLFSVEKGDVRSSVGRIGREGVERGLVGCRDGCHEGCGVL